jgi:putative ABC transport system ATP-binding protein
MLELRGLTKSYQEGEGIRTVFRDLELRLEDGRHAVILGRSGSGKSTLLNLISGIDLPDSGEVRIDGTCLNGLGERDRTLFRRDHIGFVFQFFNLLHTLTVLENLLLPLELKRGRIGDEEREQARNLLARVGLAERAATFPDRLSGGEQQRVAIARALIHRPKLLLADEPTGNLDAETGRRVLDLLAELVADAGMTLLTVTHSRDLAEGGDRVLTLREGRLEPEEERS